MRDLVIPSFAAARRADRRFSEAETRLPQYAEMGADDNYRSSVYREAQLAKLGADAANLLQETVAIEKALHDSRLTTKGNDPQVDALREQLENLYAAQERRAELLSEFVQREVTSLAVQKVGMENGSALISKPVPGGPAAGHHADTAKAAPATAPPGMPVVTGLIPIADRAQLRDWGHAAALAVRNTEDKAAQVFFPVARDCRDGAR